MKVRLTNLSNEVTEADLLQTFGAFGEVASATIKKEKVSGKVARIAYVEMPDNSEAGAAIQGLKGRNLKGKPITILGAKGKQNFAKRVEPRRSAGDKKGGGRGGRR